MKWIYRNITFFILMIGTIPCFSNIEREDGNFYKKTSDEIRLVILDPGHFHASLLQKNILAHANDTVRVYAPKGNGLNQYLNDIYCYNHRKDNPTHWYEIVYDKNDYLTKMLNEHQKGDIVIIAGNNQKKTKYILNAIKGGYNVLSDKPMAINKNDFRTLIEAYRLAKEKGLFLYDLMTERYDILNRVEKYILHDSAVFGSLQKGTIERPAVIMQSVHYFFKNVSGKLLIRPAWYYDVEQQGEGIADVTTHLIDLINWQCFPGKTIRYRSDIKLLKANHWATHVSLEEFSKSTQCNSFPNYLQKYVTNSTLNVLANGSLHYTVKDINASITVKWNFYSPNGGDTFFSIKRGSKATIKIIQNKESQYERQLYVQRGKGIPPTDFKKHLYELIKKLNVVYPFISFKDTGNGLYLIDIPIKNRLGHEAHFSKVAECFFQYLHTRKIPEWENENTITKYYITTTAVDMAKKGDKNE